MTHIESQPQTDRASRNSARAARLGLNHGYRIAGDIACLNAELAITRDASRAQAERWALQLWACEAPYAGGRLSGIKVAEAALDLSHTYRADEHEHDHDQQHAVSNAPQPQAWYAETSAHPPAGDRAYTMVMVLTSRAAQLGASHSVDASDSSDTTEHVHDFANYPAREHFHVPRFRGDVSAHYAQDAVTLHIERLENPRAADNLSGSLVLELWALDQAYAGGAFTGRALAGQALGQITGQDSLGPLSYHLALGAQTSTQQGFHVLMLREWTAAGYVTRDYRELDAPPAAAVTAALQTAQMPAKPEPRDMQTAPQPQPVLISIQRASLDELARVPGLNRKLAAAIIKARPYRAFEDLKRVRGIGDATLRRLRAVLAL